MTPAQLQQVAVALAQSSHVPSSSEEDPLEVMVGAARDGGRVLVPAAFGADPAKGRVPLAGAEGLTPGAATAQPLSLGLFGFCSELCVTLKTDTTERKQCPFFPHASLMEMKGQHIFTCKEIRVTW